MSAEVKLNLGSKRRDSASSQLCLYCLLYIHTSEPDALFIPHTLLMKLHYTSQQLVLEMVC